MKRLRQIARVPSGGSRTLLEYLLLMGALTFTIAVILYALTHRSGTNAGSISQVVAAANRISFRPIEGRLVGGLAYRPAKHRLRSAPDPLANPTQRQFLILADTISAAGPSDTDAKIALSTAMLFADKQDSSIAVLEKQVLASTKGKLLALAFRHVDNSKILNNLSALYLDRSSERGLPDVLLAVEAAEWGWRLRRSPEIAWNRALAREALHVRASALTAWNDYLALDSESPWAVEARSHVHRLSEPAHARRWVLARREFDSDQTPYKYAALVEEFPQEVRTYAEDTLIPLWAERCLNSDASAVIPLETARVIGNELRDGRGECLLADSVASILAADTEKAQRLALLHMRYASAKAVLLAQQPVAAAVALSNIERGFVLEGSAFAGRAALYAATAHYYAGALDDAEKQLRQTMLSLDHPRRYPTLVGQVEWLRGLIDVSRGRNNEACSEYVTALTSFVLAGESENRAAIESLLAERHRYVGREDDASTYEERALRSLDALGTTRRSHAILTNAAASAAQNKTLLAALVFQDDLVAITRGANDAVSTCDALIGRSRLAAEVGERTIAEADISEVHSRILDIKDPAMRKRTFANLLATEAAVWRILDPIRAADAAERAISHMASLGHRIRMAELHLEAGRAQAASRRRVDALRTWREGIAECERERANLSNRDDRRTYFERCRSLFDEAIGMLMEEGQVVDAFSLAERGRAREFQESMPRGRADNAAVSSALSPGVTVVSYWLLRDRMALWWVDATFGIRGLTHSLDRDTLAQRVVILADDRRSDSEFDGASADVYDMLIEPIGSRIASRVVVIPDGEVYRVPFAALKNRHTGRYLVQDHEVTVAPSYAFSQLGFGSATWHRPRRVLMINAGNGGGGPAGDVGALPGVKREIAEVAAFYDDPWVIDAALSSKVTVLAEMRSAEMIHFAGHGRHATRLVEPALVLRPGDHESGLLYPHEISLLSLSRTSLVVLGSCGSAAGKIGTEGAMSIARAFLVAGTHRVVATLWDVEDDEASAILTSFHRLLCAGYEPSRAVRIAQMDAIREAIPARQWAAFELIQREL
jgi:CHAT domain-containing protein